MSPLSTLITQRHKTAALHQFIYSRRCMFRQSEFLALPVGAHRVQLSQRRRHGIDALTRQCSHLELAVTAGNYRSVLIAQFTKQFESGFALCLQLLL